MSWINLGQFLPLKTSFSSIKTSLEFPSESVEKESVNLLNNKYHKMQVIILELHEFWPFWPRLEVIVYGRTIQSFMAYQLLNLINYSAFRMPLLDSSLELLNLII